MPVIHIDNLHEVNSITIRRLSDSNKKIYKPEFISITLDGAEHSVYEDTWKGLLRWTSLKLFTLYRDKFMSMLEFNVFRHLSSEPPDPDRPNRWHGWEWVEGNDFIGFSVDLNKSAEEILGTIVDMVSYFDKENRGVLVQIITT